MQVAFLAYVCRRIGHLTYQTFENLATLLMPSIALDWSRFIDCLADASRSKLQMLLYISNKIYLLGSFVADLSISLYEQST